MYDIAKKRRKAKTREAASSPASKDDSYQKVTHFVIYISLSVTKAVFVVPAAEAKKLATLPVNIFGSSFLLQVDTEEETINEAKAQEPPVTGPRHAFLSVRMFGGDSESMIEAMQEKLNQRLARITQIKASMHGPAHWKVVECV